MAYPTHNTQHVAIGLSRLTSRFQGLPNITALLTSWLTEVQAVEDALWDVLTLRNITNGVGDQLDQIGKIVGQAREGLDDPGYRIAIALRVLANKSGGRVADVLKIALRLAQGFTADLNGVVDYQESPGMNFTIGVWNQTHPLTAASLLSEAKALGSRGVFYYSTWPKSQNLMWADSSGSFGQGVWSYSGLANPGVMTASEQL